MIGINTNFIWYNYIFIKGHYFVSLAIIRDNHIVPVTAEADNEVEKEAKAIELKDETTDADLTEEEILFKDMASKLKDYEIRINGSVLYIEKRYDGFNRKSYIYTSRDAIKVAYEFADRFPSEIESICAWYNASFMDKLATRFAISSACSLISVQ